MSSKTTSSASSGLGCTSFFVASLQVTLIVLKLIGYLETWSWLAVWMPTILYISFVPILLLILAALGVIYWFSAYLVLTLGALVGEEYKTWFRTPGKLTPTWYANKTARWLKSFTLKSKVEDKLNKKLDDLIEFNETKVYNDNRK